MTHRIVTIALCALVAACSTEDGPGPDEDPGFRVDPSMYANAVDHDHPLAEGQELFFYETFGSEAVGGWSVDFLLEVLEAEPEVFGNQFESFGFIPDPEDDLPIGLKRGTLDPSLAHETCAACHVGYTPDGRLWIGLPNVNVDTRGLLVALNERWGARGNEPLISELEKEKFALLGPGRQNTESSTSETVLPTNILGLMNLEDRTSYGWLGAEANLKTNAYLAVYMGFGVGREHEDGSFVEFPSDEYLKPWLDYMASLRSPEPPSGGDPAEVERGREVYLAEGCDGCHSLDDESALQPTPVDDSDSPLDRLPGLDEEWPDGSVATTNSLLTVQDGFDARGGGAELINFIISRRLSVSMSPGYRTPDLRGVWATAPYLHNGSVPDLDALLRPVDERPRRFTHAGFELDVDAIWTNSNQGHEFGTDLSEEDRAALVAYLLSL